MPAPEIRPGIRRLFRLATGRPAQDDADEEIRLHLKLRTDQLIQEGMTPEAARAEAERRFGALDEERDQRRNWTRRREHRARLRDWTDILRQDARYAIHSLRRDPGFTSFAILIVALGIGACVTVFSLLNGVLLRPLPFRDAGRLVWISNIADDGVAEWRLQVGHYLDLGARSRSLDGLAGYYAYYGLGDAALGSGAETERLTLVPVTCNFFPFLGVSPVLGRSFTADECGFGAPPVVVLSHELWRRQYASDPAVVGRSVTLNNAPATIIGVLPVAFDFASVFTPGRKVDLFSPYTLTEENHRRGNTLATIGRLRPGASVGQARAELVGLGTQLSAEFPRRNTLRPRVEALDARINGRFRPALMLLASAVAAVMLIVSANLSSLQFARSSSRQREMAVRLALGAPRGRLIRQALTESLVLTGVGALGGVVLAVVGTRALSRLDTFDIPLLGRVGVDGTALAVAALIAVVAGLLIGVLPALQAPRDVRDGLNDGKRGATRGVRHARARAVLVVSEMAAASALLVGAGLLVRSFARVLDVELGFRPERVEALRIDPATQFVDLPTANAWYDDALRRVRGVAGVRAAALADVLPFDGDRSWAVAGEGQVYQRNQYPEAFIRVVSDSYFTVMGIPVRAGREFSAGDAPESEPVVVLNQNLARTLWPDRDPIGQRIRQGRRLFRVVGVVGSVRHNALERGFTGEMYFSIHQFEDYARVHLVVDTDLPESALSAGVRAALQPLAADLPRNQWRPLQQFVDRVASPRRFVVILLGGFAGLALVLAALGIYALVSYGVSQRSQEIGIRMALGASAGSVQASVMGRTLRLAAVGMGLGSVASVFVAWSLRELLFGVTPADPVSFLAAFGLLTLVAGAGGYVPARRASRVDPAVVLK